MRISINPSRNPIVGQDIDVSVSTDDTLIVQVTSILDGSELADEKFDSPLSQYDRSFKQVGYGGPNMEHQLTVTAIDDQSKETRAVREWKDVI